MEKNKTILITGGVGYVGSLLTIALLEKGYKVRVLDNLMWKKCRFLHLLRNPDFEFINGDIRNPKDVSRAVKEVDMVLHLAAIVGMPACRADPELATSINVGGTEVVNDFRRNIPMIYASTGSIYGMATELCTEETPPFPTSLYGSTKWEAEKIVMERENTVTLRFATAFGFSFYLRHGNLMVDDFVRDAVFKKQLVVYDKDFNRSFIHIKDMVKSYLFTIENFEKMKGQIYNVGSDDLNFTKEQLAQRIKEKIPFELIFTERPNHDKRNYAISYKKIKSLGFETRVGIDEGIDELIKGFNVLKLCQKK